MTSEPGSHFLYHLIKIITTSTKDFILQFTKHVYLMIPLSQLRTMKDWHCCFHFTNEERILAEMGEIEKAMSVNQGREEDRLLEVKETMGSLTAQWRAESQ